jgi:hypothetical protein
MKLDSLPCNPIYDEGYSTKRKIYSRHTFSTGTTGNGFFVLNCRLGTAPVAGRQMYYTSNAFAGSGISTASLPAGVQGENPNYPYGVASVPTPDGWKLVSLGIKCRPTGPYLNTSGMIYRISVPRNSPTNELTAAQISSGVNLPWMSVKHGAAYQVNFVTKDQSVDDQYGVDNSNPVHYWSHGFYVSGAVAAYSFSVEVIQYWEYSFNLDTPSDATPTPTIQQAKDLNSKITDATIGNQDFSESSIMKTLKDVGKAVIEGVGGVASDYASGWFKSNGFSTPYYLKDKPFSTATHFAQVA